MSPHSFLANYPFEPQARRHRRATLDAIRIWPHPAMYSDPSNQGWRERPADLFLEVDHAGDEVYRGADALVWDRRGPQLAIELWSAWLHPDRHAPVQSTALLKATVLNPAPAAALSTADRISAPVRSPFASTRTSTSSGRASSPPSI